MSYIKGYDVFNPKSIRNYLKELYDEKQKLNKEHETLIVEIKRTDEEIEKVEILLDEATEKQNRGKAS
jgi:predicted  nucleic acid-binding Zn-ribbon protein